MLNSPWAIQSPYVDKRLRNVDRVGRLHVTAPYWQRRVTAGVDPTSCMFLWRGMQEAEGRRKRHIYEGKCGEIKKNWTTYYN